VQNQDRIVAVSLLSERELAIVGQTLRRVYRIDEVGGDFDELLRAIDVAEERSPSATRRSEGN
jgi:hypothetical protein